jgi:hypothetical protein
MGGIPGARLPGGMHGFDLVAAQLAKPSSCAWRNGSAGSAVAKGAGWKRRRQSLISATIAQVSVASQHYRVTVKLEHKSAPWGCDTHRNLRLC